MSNATYVGNEHIFTLARHKVGSVRLHINDGPLQCEENSLLITDMMIFYTTTFTFSLMPVVAKLVWCVRMPPTR